MRKLVAILIANVLIMTLLLTACNNDSPSSNFSIDSENTSGTGLPESSISPTADSTLSTDLPEPNTSSIPEVDINAADIGAAMDFFYDNGNKFDMLGYIYSLENMLGVSVGSDGFSLTTAVYEDIYDHSGVFAVEGYWQVKMQIMHYSRYIDGVAQEYFRYNLGADYYVPCTIIGLLESTQHMYLSSFTVEIPQIEYLYGIATDIKSDVVEIEVQGNERIRIERGELISLISMLQRLNENPSLAFDPLNGYKHNIEFASLFVNKNENLSGYRVLHEGTIEELFCYYDIYDTDEIFDNITVLYDTTTNLK